eukprot:g2046.t1
MNAPYRHSVSAGSLSDVRWRSHNNLQDEKESSLLHNSQSERKLYSQPNGQQRQNRHRKRLRGRQKVQKTKTDYRRNHGNVNSQVDFNSQIVNQHKLYSNIDLSLRIPTPERENIFRDAIEKLISPSKSRFATDTLMLRERLTKLTEPSINEKQKAKMGMFLNSLADGTQPSKVGAAKLNASKSTGRGFGKRCVRCTRLHYEYLDICAICATKGIRVKEKSPKKLKTLPQQQAQKSKKRKRRKKVRSTKRGTPKSSSSSSNMMKNSPNVLQSSRQRIASLIKRQQDELRERQDMMQSHHLERLFEQTHALLDVEERLPDYLPPSMKITLAPLGPPQTPSWLADLEPPENQFYSSQFIDNSTKAEEPASSFKNHHETYHASVIIQCFFRIFRAKKRVIERRHQRILEQQERIDNAATRIQTVVRGRQARRLVRHLMKVNFRSVYAIPIQRIVRGHLGRKKATRRREILEQMERERQASTLIQSTARMRKHREAFVKQKISTTRISKILRGRKQRKWYLQKRLDTIRLQSVVRACLEHKLFKRKQYATLKMQSIYRGLLGRRVAHQALLQFLHEQQVKLENHSATTIQRVWRGEKGRSRASLWKDVEGKRLDSFKYATQRLTSLLETPGHDSGDEFTLRLQSALAVHLWERDIYKAQSAVWDLYMTSPENVMIGLQLAILLFRFSAMPSVWHKLEESFAALYKKQDDGDEQEDDETRIGRIRDLVETRIYNASKLDEKSRTRDEMRELFYSALKFHPQSAESCCQLAIFEQLVMKDMETAEKYFERCKKNGGLYDGGMQRLYNYFTEMYSHEIRVGNFDNVVHNTIVRLNGIPYEVAVYKRGKHFMIKGFILGSEKTVAEATAHDVEEKQRDNLEEKSPTGSKSASSPSQSIKTVKSKHKGKGKSKKKKKHKKHKKERKSKPLSPKKAGGIRRQYSRVIAAPELLELLGKLDKPELIKPVNQTRLIQQLLSWLVVRNVNGRRDFDISFTQEPFPSMTCVTEKSRFYLSLKIFPCGKATGESHGDIRIQAFDAKHDESHQIVVRKLLISKLFCHKPILLRKFMSPGWRIKGLPLIGKLTKLLEIVYEENEDKYDDEDDVERKSPRKLRRRVMKLDNVHFHTKEAKRHLAATKIQRIFRGKQGRKKAYERLLYVRATWLQCFARGAAARKELLLRRFQKKRWHQQIKIASFYRGCIARRELKAKLQSEFPFSGGSFQKVIKAMILQRTAVKKYESNPDKLSNMMNAALYFHTFEHDYEKAKEIYEQALKLAPTNAPLLYSYAILRMVMLQGSDLEINIDDTQYELWGTHEDRKQQVRGEGHGVEGQRIEGDQYIVSENVHFKEALEIFRRAFNSDPNRNKFTVIYQSFFKRAASIHFNSPRAVTNFAVAQAHAMNDYAKARSSFRNLFDVIAERQSRGEVRNDKFMESAILNYKLLKEILTIRHRSGLILTSFWRGVISRRRLLYVVGASIAQEKVLRHWRKYPDNQKVMYQTVFTVHAIVQNFEIAKTVYQEALDTYFPDDIFLKFGLAVLLVMTSDDAHAESMMDKVKQLQHNLVSENFLEIERKYFREALEIPNANSVFKARAMCAIAIIEEVVYLRFNQAEQLYQTALLQEPLDEIVQRCSHRFQDLHAGQIDPNAAKLKEQLRKKKEKRQWRLQRMEKKEKEKQLLLLKEKEEALAALKERELREQRIEKKKEKQRKRELKRIEKDEKRQRRITRMQRRAKRQTRLHERKSPNKKQSE